MQSEVAASKDKLVHLVIDLKEEAASMYQDKFQEEPQRNSHLQPSVS